MLSLVMGIIPVLIPNPITGMLAVLSIHLNQAAGSSKINGIGIRVTYSVGATCAPKMR